MKSFFTGGCMQFSLLITFMLATTGCLGGVEEREDLIVGADANEGVIAEAGFELSAAGIPPCPNAGVTVNPYLVGGSCTTETCFRVIVLYENTGVPCFGVAEITVAKDNEETIYRTQTTAPTGEFNLEFDIDDIARPIEITACPFNAFSGCISTFGFIPDAVE